MSDSERVFQAIAPYPPAALFLDDSGRDLTAIPSSNAANAVISRASKNPAVARNLFVPFTISLDIPPTNFFGFNRAPPPLTLYITPSSVRRAMNKVITENRFRRGPEPEFWGDNPDVLTFSGPIASFYDYNKGITHLRRGRTPGFQNFVSLLSYYKNNGREYWRKGQVVQRDDIARRLSRVPNNGNRFATNQGSATSGQLSSPTSKENKGAAGRKLIFDREGMIKRVHSVKIDYDGYTFFGHFESFGWTEDVNSPFQISFEAVFTVNRTEDYVAKQTGRGLYRF